MGGGAKGSAGAEASYNMSTDVVKVAMGGPLDNIVRAMVHELGHRVYFKSLGSQGRTAWEEFFGANVGAPDVESIIKDWEKYAEKDKKYGAWLGHYASHLKGAGDDTALMWLSLIAGKINIQEDLNPMTGQPRKKSDKPGLEQLKDRKSEVAVFLHPVSAYSGTNPEELFAEVMSYILVDGPQKVEPIVRDAFTRAVPAIRLASRVASRYLEARAIRLDKASLLDLSKDLEEAVVRRGSNEPMGQKVLANKPFVVKAVDGSPVSLQVVLATRPSDNPDIVLDGGVGTYKGDKVVLIYLNGSQPGLKSWAQKKLLSHKLYPVLIHEMTHVSDKYTKGVGDRMTQEEARDNAAYYNDPSEVRAYMQEVVSEASERFPIWDKLVKISPTKAKAVDYLIGNSGTWAEVSPYWTTSNKQKVLKAVVQALDEYLSAE